MARTNNTIFPNINFINETIFEIHAIVRRRDDTVFGRMQIKTTTTTMKAQKKTHETLRNINMDIGYAKDLI